MCLDFGSPSESDPPLKRLQKGLALGLILATKAGKMRKWMKISALERDGTGSGSLPGKERPGGDGGRGDAVEF